MLIVILLVMIVGLTVGLFLVGRTTVDVSLTTKMTDSSRAFNAAEAGIEEAIINSSVVQNAPIPVVTGQDPTYTVNVAPLGGGSQIFPSTIQLPWQQGKEFTVWLVPHNPDGTLSTARYYTNNTIAICFGTAATLPGQPDPAVAVTLFYRSPALDSRISYFGYDASSTVRTPGFGVASHTPAAPANQCITNGYWWGANVNFNADFGVDPTNAALFGAMQALRIRPLYIQTAIAVVPHGGVGGVLPAQGDTITSSGNAGETVRKIDVDKEQPRQPPFMDYTIYSYQGSLSK